MDKFGLNFGLVIAYLIPGFLGLYALAERVSIFKALLGGDKGVPEAAALVPMTTLALAIGIIINAVSWALLRPLISVSGVRRPAALDYAKLKEKDIAVYNVVVEANFRYHQFYGNMLVAVLLLTPRWLVRPVAENLVQDASFFFVTVVLFFAARDSLKRAYTRLEGLLTKEDTHD
jgi:hypothetical protein